MRGDDEKLQAGMFSYIALEDRIPKNHPLRGIRQLVDGVLKGLSPEFERLYAKVGRPSIPPERLLRALLLQAIVMLTNKFNHPLTIDRERDHGHSGIKAMPVHNVNPLGPSEVH